MQHSTTREHIQGKSFFYVFLLLIILASLLVLWPYLNTLIFAFLISFLAQPIYRYLLKLFKGRSSLATSMTTLIVFIALFILIFIIGRIVIGQALEFANLLQQAVSSTSDNDSLQIEKILVSLNKFLAGIPLLDLQISEQQFNSLLQRVLEPAGSAILNVFSGLGAISTNLAGFLAGIFTKLFIFAMALVALIPNFNNFRKFLERLSPLDNEVDDLFFNRTLAMSKAMLKGSLIIAFVQGSISGISFWIADIPYTAFWTLIMILLSIIPLGAGLISIPAGLILMLTGDVPMGVFLILTNLLIVGNIDNVLRPELTPKEASLPSVLVLAGVFGGIAAFGTMGVVYGPVILVLLVTGIETYQKHYRSSST